MYENTADLSVRHHDRRDLLCCSNPSLSARKQRDQTAGRDETKPGILGNVSELNGKVGGFR